VEGGGGNVDACVRSTELRQLYGNIKQKKKERTIRSEPSDTEKKRGKALT
jgi:hypothetical protein